MATLKKEGFVVKASFSSSCRAVFLNVIAKFRRQMAAPTEPVRFLLVQALLDRWRFSRTKPPEAGFLKGQTQKV